MTTIEEKQLRGWAIDYALRLHNKEEVVSAKQIIKEAVQFYAFIEGRPPAQIHEIKSRKKVSSAGLKLEPTMPPPYYRGVLPLNYRARIYGGRRLQLLTYLTARHLCH